MSLPANRSPLEEQIAQWRGYLRRRRAIDGPDVEELESHLRDQVTSLTEAGLAPDEAFLVAVKRMGRLDELSREFALEHSDRLWKQLVMTSGVAGEPDASTRKEAFVAIGLAIAAGAAVKVPALFGLHIIPDVALPPFYFRNASLLVLPMLIAYLSWKRRPNVATTLLLFLPCAIGAIFANVYPGGPDDDTFALSALHLPIALWLSVGLAYAGGRWFTGSSRMDFVRFSGELAIYYVLIAMGGGVLTGFTMMMFYSIGIEAQWLAAGWVLPCGAAGAVIIGSWLVEAKQSVIENMAPVLTKVFTPLFTLLLLAFLGTMIWTGNPIDVQREVLIAFDLLLIVVVGLVLYSVSARDTQSSPGFFDRLQFVLIVCALLADALALAAIATRISEFGFTPNRTAALGENLILLVNLVWSAWLYAQFLRGRGSFSSLERWQVNYLPAYSLWAAIVVIAFPPLFAYI